MYTIRVLNDIAGIILLNTVTSFLKSKSEQRLHVLNKKLHIYVYEEIVEVNNDKRKSTTQESVSIIIFHLSLHGKRKLNWITIL